MSLPVQLLQVSLAAVIFIGCTVTSDRPTVFDAWTPDDKAHLLSELDLSHDAIMSASIDLNDAQWHFRESPGRWSIAEIVEHLQLQDLMFWRELYVITQFPEMHYYHGMRKAPDSVFLEYSTVTDENTSEAPWYILPYGRWDSKEHALEIYAETREKIRDIVAGSDVDFRQHITPRGWGDHAELRDLHQLMLIMVAHTDRHLSQIRRVKEHPGFPQE